MYVCMYVCPRTPPSVLDRFPSNWYQNFPSFSGHPTMVSDFKFSPLGGPLKYFDHFSLEYLTHTLSYASDQFFFFPKNVEESKADKSYSEIFFPTVDGFAAKTDFYFIFLK